jgi:hypothetical protein
MVVEFTMVRPTIISPPITTLAKLKLIAPFRVIRGYPFLERIVFDQRDIHVSEKVSLVGAANLSLAARR